ncbi:hypothetical protein KC726_04315 [Candidatus Woesebacteria bacterium]|nr:hypothetical protein [Candidatus Woesebacteria bacterium]
MKIVYIDSPFKKNPVNKSVMKYLEDAKHKVFDGTLPKEIDEEILHSVNAKLTREIKKCDCVVVEATESSFDMGRFIMLALLQHKPVLILQEKSKAQSYLLSSHRLVTEKKYKMSQLEKDLQTILESFIKIVKKQRLTYRFNLMLSKDLNIFLMDQSQVQGISKADYIRNLIVSDMEESA